MANDCLVTKLKSVVNNDSLEILGTIEFDVIPMTITSGEQQQKMSIGTQEGDVVVTVSDGGYFATTLAGLDVEESRLTSYAVPASETGYAYPLYFKNGSYKIRIKSKYKVYQIALPDATSGHIININVDKVHDCHDLVSLKSNTTKMYGDIANLASCPIITFAAYGCSGLYGDIKNLNQARGINIYSTGVYGDVASLVSDVGEFTASGCVGVYGDVNKFKNATTVRIGSTGISGSIQSLVESAWSAGRRTGSITIDINNCEVESMPNIYTNSSIIITFSATEATVKNQGGEVQHTYNGTWS